MERGNTEFCLEDEIFLEKDHADYLNDQNGVVQLNLHEGQLVALVLLKRLTWVHLTFEIAKNNFFIRNFYLGRVKNVTLCIGGDEGRDRASTLPLS